LGSPEKSALDFAVAKSALLEVPQDTDLVFAADNFLKRHDRATAVEHIAVRHAHCSLIARGQTRWPALRRVRYQFCPYLRSRSLTLNIDLPASTPHGREHQP